MGYLPLLVILVTLPLILSILKSQPHRRPLAVTGIALALFFGSAPRVDGTVMIDIGFIATQMHATAPARRQRPATRPERTPAVGPSGVAPAAQRA